MKGYIKILVRVIIVSIVILVNSGYMTKADDFIKGHSTAYCLQGITRSGEMTHEGICAGAKKYLGKTIEIYQRLPDNSLGCHLGTFECKDTGNTKAIKNGTCIDVWMSNKDMCQQWMNKVYADGCKGKIYFKIIEKN
jgi:3D (Asp-Asp-Asp) domain-containing protein